MESRYDLAVIGSGPAGQRAAIGATKLGKRVAVIDRKGSLGGVSLHTGTIPSKTLREAILYLSGFRQRSFYGKNYVLKENISGEDLALRVRLVHERELEVVRDHFRRNGVGMKVGLARFMDPHTLEVVGDGGVSTMLGANEGILRILFDPSSLKTLGIHILGKSAAELIHIGQAIIAVGGTIEYFRDAVFNYPTLAEAYKVAAMNGLNRLSIA